MQTEKEKRSVEKEEAKRNVPVPMVGHPSAPVDRSSKKGSGSASGSSTVKSNEDGATENSHLSQKPSKKGKSQSAGSGSGSSTGGSDNELGKKGTLICDGKSVDSEVRDCSCSS